MTVMLHGSFSMAESCEMEEIKYFELDSEPMVGLSRTSASAVPVVVILHLYISAVRLVVG